MYGLRLNVICIRGLGYYNNIIYIQIYHVCVCTDILILHNYDQMFVVLHTCSSGSIIDLYTCITGHC